MTAKDYCSKVCGAKCCRPHSGVEMPGGSCPALDKGTNLCTIYANRLGFEFSATGPDGEVGTCRCSPVATFAPKLPEEIRAQCCYVHPELLEGSEEEDLADARSGGEGDLLFQN